MRNLDQLLGELAVKGVDPDGVAEYVVGGLAAHRRHRNLAAGVAAALVLLGAGTAVALSGAGDPDEVVADRKAAESVERSSTEVTEPTVPTVAGETTASLPPSSVPAIPTTSALRPTPRAGAAAPVPVVPAPVTVGPAPPSTAAPTTSPTSTTVPDQPLQATLVVATPTVAVGDVVRVSVNWSDPDLPPEAQPVASYSFGDPNVGSAAAAVDAASACTGGGARSGSMEAGSRYTTAGVRTVTVVVSSCGRLLTLTAPVTVTEARYNGLPGRSVVVRVGAGAIDPEAVSWAWVPEGGNAAEPLPPRQVGTALRSGPERLASTVVVLPATGPGRLRMQVPGGCTLESAVVDLAAVPADQQAVVAMPGACP